MTAVVRPARPEDGPAIGKLFRDADAPDLALDWSAPGIADWWLVAERDGVVVGALQLVAAQPIGYIGEVIVARSEMAPQLAPAARALYDVAETLLRASGCQRVAATLRGRAGWTRLVTRYTGMREHTEPVVLVSKELGP